jgi:hypothetical protein
VRYVVLARCFLQSLTRNVVSASHLLDLLQGAANSLGIALEAAPARQNLQQAFASTRNPGLKERTIRTTKVEQDVVSFLNVRTARSPR